MKRLSAVLFLVLLSSGCASMTPEILRDAPTDSPSLAEVVAQPGAFAGRRVLWGGTLARIENRAEATLLEVVERPLADYGRPYQTDRSGGRFLARIGGFLDPAIYAPGREVTLVGPIEGQETRRVGEREMSMPMVAAESLHLWSEPYPRDRYLEPYYYDPYPFGPYYYHPYPYPYLYPYPYPAYRYFWR